MSPSPGSPGENEHSEQCVPQSPVAPPQSPVAPPQSPVAPSVTEGVDVYHGSSISDHAAATRPPLVVDDADLPDDRPPTPATTTVIHFGGSGTLPGTPPHDTSPPRPPAVSALRTPTGRRLPPDDDFLRSGGGTTPPSPPTMALSSSALLLLEQQTQHSALLLLEQQTQHEEEDHIGLVPPLLSAGLLRSSNPGSSDEDLGGGSGGSGGGSANPFALGSDESDLYDAKTAKALAADKLRQENEYMRRRFKFRERKTDLSAKFTDFREGEEVRVFKRQPGGPHKVKVDRLNYEGRWVRSEVAEVDEDSGLVKVEFEGGAKSLLLDRGSPWIRPMREAEIRQSRKDEVELAALTAEIAERRRREEFGLIRQGLDPLISKVEDVGRGGFCRSFRYGIAGS